MDLFISTDPVWDGFNLVITHRLVNDEPSLRMVEFLVKQCLTWHDWSETRWCKIYSAGAKWIHSIVVGMVGDHRSFSALIHGHKKPTQVRECLVVSTVAAQPPETVNPGLFKDDRFVMIGPDLRSSAWRQIEDIVIYPAILWERLAAVVCPDTNPFVLRNKCLNATLAG